LLENRTYIERGDLQHLVAGVFSLKNEVSLANLAIFNSLFGAAAGPRVLEVVD
jgi:hypothetical protein